MRHYHIGLDFGTYQTKACVLDVESDTHEFFAFRNSDVFFYLSKVGVRPDRTLVYGDSDEIIEEEYYYFKIASAEDEEFHAVTQEGPVNETLNFYQYNEFRNFTPEFLSAVYIADVLFQIKEAYKRRNKKSEGRGGLIGGLLNRQKKQEDQVRFTIELGIPTEWSQKSNLRRKRKFESILLIAEELQKRYGTRSSFSRATVDELKREVQKIYTDLDLSSKDKFYDLLNTYGVKVYPETAAGLSFILRTKQLPPGYYAALDIGGGSTDVSFFKVQSDYSIRYYASESYLLASNNVFKHYQQGGSSLKSLHDAETEVHNLLKSDQWDDNEYLVSALTKVDKGLDDKVYKLFNKRVWKFDLKMNTKYNDQPVIVYGGGAKLPYLGNGAIKIHDNGSQSLNVTWSYIKKDNIASYAGMINLKPERELWQESFHMLVVALGLSFLKPDGGADWFDDTHYRATDNEQPELVPHPFNEDCYIYDVINARWNT